MFLNIQIDLLILKTYDGQFTSTTKKSLHIIFKQIANLLLSVEAKEFRKAVRIWQNYGQEYGDSNSNQLIQFCAPPCSDTTSHEYTC